MSTEQNKSLIKRFNEEVLEKGNMDVLRQLATPDFIDYSAPAGRPPGLDGMIHFLTSIVHAAFSDLKVSINDMVAEHDKVVTRKIITGIHSGALMGIPATGKNISISVIDIMSIKDGKITAHWAEHNFPSVIQSLMA